MHASCPKRDSSNAQHRFRLCCKYALLHLGLCICMYTADRWTSHWSGSTWQCAAWQCADTHSPNAQSAAWPISHQMLQQTQAWPWHDKMAKVHAACQYTASTTWSHSQASVPCSGVLDWLVHSLDLRVGVQGILALLTPDATVLVASKGHTWAGSTSAAGTVSQLFEPTCKLSRTQQSRRQV